MPGSSIPICGCSGMGLIMNISSTAFGALPDGRTVTLFTLRNSSGLEAGIINYGGTLVSLTAPDRNGRAADVVLGHAGMAEYICNNGYLGASVGRNSNRITDARFTLDGTVYRTDANNNGNNLHGGTNGLSFRLMDAVPCERGGNPALALRASIGDGEDKFPGNIEISVTYILTENALVIKYDAVSDAKTVINLTNHTYFNLAGHDSGGILGHTLRLDARHYTPLTEAGLPTGEILSVSGTPLDFTAPKAIGCDISSSHMQVSQFGGFDHNFVLSGSGYRCVGEASEPVSGRAMRIWTDRPAIQLYTANMLDTAPAYKNGVKYNKHQGFCLETQGFTDAVNFPWFPSVIYGAGEHFKSVTAYEFFTV